jgi:hypothetical protein
MKHNKNEIAMPGPTIDIARIMSTIEMTEVIIVIIVIRIPTIIIEARIENKIVIVAHLFQLWRWSRDYTTMILEHYPTLYKRPLDGPVSMRSLTNIIYQYHMEN